MGPPKRIDIKPFMLIVGVVVVGLALVAVFRSVQFAQGIEAQRRQLLAVQASGPVDTAALPDLVRAFAERNGGQRGGPEIMVMQQQAEMRLAPDQPYFELAAEQVFATRRPGFVWQARGRMASVVPVSVVDSYVDGIGILEARIGGVLTVAHSAGPETARGEAMRYLAELPFNPDAILNAPDLHWEQVDVDTVAVSLETIGGLARVLLHFDEAGDVTTASAADRPRDVDGATVPTPWLGYFSSYDMIGGYRLPLTAEVAWQMPAGEFVYWRGHITAFGGQ